MFKKSFCKLATLFSVVLVFSIVLSCEKTTTVNFEELSLVDNEGALIEINVPLAKGSTKSAKKINQTLTHFVNTALNVEGVSTTKPAIKDNVAGFKKAYIDFKTQIEKTLSTNLPAWEVLIDGDVAYKTEALASIAMSSSINTGGAHGILVFEFYNFDLTTGKQLTITDLVTNIPEFTTLVKKYYTKELLSFNDAQFEAVDDATFALPENLGFNNDGVILFYQTNTSGANNVVEFTIPYVVANEYLSF